MRWCLTRVSSSGRAPTACTQSTGLGRTARPEPVNPLSLINNSLFLCLKTTLPDVVVALAQHKQTAAVRKNYFFNLCRARAFSSCSKTNGLFQNRAREYSIKKPKQNRNVLQTHTHSLCVCVYVKQHTHFRMGKLTQIRVCAPYSFPCVRSVCIPRNSRKRALACLPACLTHSDISLSVRCLTPVIIYT